MDTDIEIIKYFDKLSKGVVKLLPVHVQKIRDILNTAPSGSPFVNLLHYNNIKGSYEQVRTIKTTDQQIHDVLIRMLQRKQVMQVYKYECFNSAQEWQCDIYTVSPALFD